MLERLSQNHNKCDVLRLGALIAHTPYSLDGKQDRFRNEKKKVDKNKWSHMCNITILLLSKVFMYQFYWCRINIRPRISVRKISSVN